MPQRAIRSRDSLRIQSVELRYHPLMSYGRVPNWPPLWTCIGGDVEAKARGEIGTLREVLPSQTAPGERIFLIVDYDGHEYIGCLMFSDLAFCRQMFDLLKGHRGSTIHDIGGLDLSHLL